MTKISIVERLLREKHITPEEAVALLQYDNNPEPVVPTITYIPYPVIPVDPNGPWWGITSVDSPNHKIY